MDAGSILDFLPLLHIILPLFFLVVFAVVILIVVFTLRRATRQGGPLAGQPGQMGQMMGPGIMAQIQRAMDAGTPYPGQLEAQQYGPMGEATILDANELECVTKNRTLHYYRGRLVVDVRLPGVAPYRAPCEQWFPYSEWASISAGGVVPVRVHPQNLQLVFVDFAARQQGRAQKEQNERDAHARRQAELLRGGR